MDSNSDCTAESFYNIFVPLPDAFFCQKLNFILKSLVLIIIALLKKQLLLISTCSKSIILL